uniref:Aluminum-activated malate transporter 1 n=1 Tax=Holcus lanatus TaxID=29679 RepID=T2HG99_HOLLA|nr:aluminum-activated malate transporter 1 [Holcus lanatus]BAN78903.1 aluminum-activated malate transporter 1 [Holcus lanatus]
MVGVIASCGLLLHSLLAGLGRRAAGFARKVGEIAREDPRRVVHSLKVGLALALVSVVYFVTPLFNSLGDSTMWAVLTVVVVMEYTVGATLSKGLNRGFATLVAACIAVGAHKLAELAERFGVGEAISLAVFVFFIASAATFLRFIPEIKAKYDYGVTIFILTFSLVAVSSYRVEELIKLAHDRFYTIIVGVLICLLTTVFVFPVWAGEGVHKLAFGNLDKLAQFFEGMESECFGENTGTDNLEGKDFLEEYKSVLNSKATEDALCTFAKWEPRHGKFRFRHPWSQYQKLGTLCRQCASSMEALASYVITTTKTQYPAAASPDLSSKVRKTCGEMSSHCAKVLRQLATATETMTVPPPANLLTVSAAMKAAECLRSELAENAAILQVMHVAVTASLLADLVAQVKEIAECVDVLARHAHFKKPKDARRDVAVDILSRGRSGPLPDVVIQCAE